MISHLIEATELIARLDDPNCIVIDASWYLPAMQRDPDEEYRRVCIPGAARFDLDRWSDHSSPYPHMLPDPEQFADAMRYCGVSDDSEVIVYDGMGLFSAPRLWWMLRSYGHGDVRVLNGGLPAWEREGYVTELGEDRDRGGRFTQRSVNPGYWADAHDVLTAMNGLGSLVIDARSLGRFKGSDPEPRAGLRSGHIPESRNIPYAEVLDATGKLQPLDVLRARFTAAGVSPNHKLVTSCGSGVSACILALALQQLQFDSVAVYDASWSEWGSDATFPIARFSQS